jgi:hypothetical protein
MTATGSTGAFARNAQANAVPLARKDLGEPPTSAVSSTRSSTRCHHTSGPETLLLARHASTSKAYTQSHRPAPRGPHERVRAGRGPQAFRPRERNGREDRDRGAQAKGRVASPDPAAERQRGGTPSVPSSEDTRRGLGSAPGAGLARAASALIDDAEEKASAPRGLTPRSAREARPKTSSALLPSVSGPRFSQSHKLSPRARGT